MSEPFMINEPNGETLATFMFAHGAGAPMDSDFMNKVAEQLTARGVKVLRFEFPYMRERRLTGKRRPPNREPELLATWRERVAEVRDAPLFIGGKSMGGRMASLIVDELGVKGLICLGYPFHPQGKPERLRTAHLESLETPTLIVQGTRDALGSREEVDGYRLSPTICLHWLEDGDHDLRPRVKSGFTHNQHIQSCVEAMVVFMKGVIA